LNAGKILNDLNFTDTLDSKSTYDNNTLTQCFENAKSHKISRLELSRKSIISVPNEIGTLTSLETLILSNNKITDLPIAFSKLINLKILDLGVNSLTFIPQVIYSLSTLTELHLEHNKITKIDPDISELVNLEVLNLFANQITVIPDQVCNLLKIRKLDFGINFINQYPQELLEKDIEFIMDDLPMKMPKLKHSKKKSRPVIKKRKRSYKKINQKQNLKKPK